MITRTRLLLATGTVLLAAFVLPSAASAAIFTVDSALDTNLTACTGAANDCTLRGAINASNANNNGPTVDTITFNLAPGSHITIDNTLPALTDPVLIDGSGSTVSVTGSANYVSTNCGGGTNFALDLTSSAATAAKVSQLPFNNVCGRAIKSNVAAPSVTIGPRQADNSLPVSGSSGGGSTVEIFKADSAPNSGEADSFLVSTVGSPSYSVVPTPELTSGQKLTATSTGPLGTSTFSARATVPADITSPTLINAVAVSNSMVRLDFSEAIGAGSVNPSEFNLAVANVARPLTAATALGNSVYLTSSSPWLSGEGGSIVATGAGRVTDPVGNQLVGLPNLPVYAGPGEIVGPVISSFRLQPNRFCKRVTKSCKRGSTYVYLTLNKPARVIFDVLRGTVKKKLIVTFIHKLPAGRTKFKFTGVVSGKTLSSITMTLRATAEDVARTLSVPVETPFRIVTNKALL